MSALEPDVSSIEAFLRQAISHWKGLLVDEPAVLELSVIQNGGGRSQKSFDLTEGGISKAAKWAAHRNMTEGANLYWEPQPKRPAATNKVASNDDIIGLAYLCIDVDDHVEWDVDRLAAKPNLHVIT